MHRNWCELNQGGIKCDCGEAEKEDKKKHPHNYTHKNWCELNQGGIRCDCA